MHPSQTAGKIIQNHLFRGKAMFRKSMIFGLVFWQIGLGPNELAAQPSISRDSTAASLTSSYSKTCSRTYPPLPFITSDRSVEW